MAEKNIQAKHLIYALNIHEAAYAGNIGFEEMVKFYQVANPSQVEEMESIIKSGDWSKFKTLIDKVLHVKLK